VTLQVDVVTIFPRMVQEPLSDGIVRRAVERGLVRIDVHDLRDYSDDRHRTVDDTAFGGGPGMVMKAEPDTAIVLLSPRGRPFAPAAARRYASLSRLVLLCGRYEGIDERVRRAVATEEVSLGDFVLTGGEVAALAVVEATVRLLPGALGDERSAGEDSFADGLLDHPHYTRPADVRGHVVPDVLLSGDHERIRRWRRREALRATRERRPDLLGQAPLTREDAGLLREIEDGESTQPSALGTQAEVVSNKQ
jgi:tRNA (guanine37-N1)-methyltransferase